MSYSNSLSAFLKQNLSFQNTESISLNDAPQSMLKTLRKNAFFILNGNLFNFEDVLNYSSSTFPEFETIQIRFRLRGGKGGFGSMLRMIGAQIEKTTNREMCRDLSGRRMRDVNNEARLKEWLAGAADREREKLNRYLEKRRRRKQMLTTNQLGRPATSSGSGEKVDNDFMQQQDEIVRELQAALDEMAAQNAIKQTSKRNRETEQTSDIKQTGKNRKRTTSTWKKPIIFKRVDSEDEDEENESDCDSLSSSSSSSDSNCTSSSDSDKNDVKSKHDKKNNDDNDEDDEVQSKKQKLK